MTIRELRPDEWLRLEHHPALHGYALPDPATSKILIAEGAGEIVGFWILVQVVHAEPIWIAPSHRSTTLAGRLWTHLREILATCRVSQAYCFSDRPDVADYLSRLGLRELPYRTFLYEAPAPCPSPSSPPA